MKIQRISLYPFKIPFLAGGDRLGALLKLTDENGNSSLGEISPLPKWSLETLQQAMQQVEDKKEKLLSANWNLKNLFEQSIGLCLFPSVAFGVESALLSLLDPLPQVSVVKSALFMGSLQEILHQADLRKKEGYVSAKLKVSQLTFEEAFQAVFQLKDVFRLRVDVNRAWHTKESLNFFSNFSIDAFDYVEEPFQNPRDLGIFTHPLAVDESFPKDLSLSHLESFPSLKSLVYKPTIQGGMSRCLPLLAWCTKKGVDLVLSSSFESEVGLGHIASFSQRLSLKAPVGVGTDCFLGKSNRS